MLLLLHLLPPYVFFFFLAEVGGGFGVSQLKLKTWTKSLFMSLEVGLILVSTSLQTPQCWSEAIPQTHLRIPLLRPLGGKDNEFLCQVEEGASPCFQKHNRQHRGQSSPKGQIYYREWTGGCSFALICIEVDELILWLDVTLHLSSIVPSAYCRLPDSNFLYNYKIMRLLIMSKRFEIRAKNEDWSFIKCGLINHKCCSCLRWSFWRSLSWKALARMDTVQCKSTCVHKRDCARFYWFNMRCCCGVTPPNSLVSQLNCKHGEWWRPWFLKSEWKSSKTPYRP